MLQSYWRPTTGSGNNYLDRIDYGYDYAGNRIFRNVRGDMIAGASVDERDQAYSYDGLHRVTDAEQGSANNTTGLIRYRWGRESFQSSINVVFCKA